MEAEKARHGGETFDFSAVLRAAGEDNNLRKTERTKARLLAGLAEDLIAGVERSDLTVATATSNAGLAHGTFYRYFADIRAGTESLIEAFSVFVRDRLAAAREGETGSRERVRSATLAYTRLFRQNAALMQCLLGMSGESTAFARAYQGLNRQWYARVAGAIARHRARISGTDAPPPSAFLPTAYALGGMIDEFLAQLYLRHDPALIHLADDEEAVADLLTDLWYRGAYGTLPEQAPDDGDRAGAATD
jgi:AcrR family transcriptional regulator